jgi:hypothetical protein
MRQVALDAIAVLGSLTANARAAVTADRQPLRATAIRNPLLGAASFLLLGLVLHAAPARATVMAAFDGGADTPLTLETLGSSPGPTIEATGGNPGGFLQLTDAVNSQHNFASFDRTDAGSFSTSSFSFDFLVDIDQVPSADGFSFSYADTGTYGTSGGLGSAPFTAEDPAAAGVLGFGFDTWSNQGAYDDPNQPGGSDYDEVSVFWDGVLIARIDDTRLLAPSLTLDDGLWHTVTGLVNFDAATVTLSVDGNALFTDLAVPGLTPFESRILFAGRTGGENEFAGIDNLLVEFDTAAAAPVPATLWLLLLGSAGILLARHRRSQHQGL